MFMTIMIIKVPQGEAPEDVRKAWVGMVLPCIGKFPSYSAGVLTGDIIYSGEELYHVSQEEAITILGQTQPRAAAWWKSQGYPKNYRIFNFLEDEAIVLSADQGQDGWG